MNAGILVIISNMSHIILICVDVDQFVVDIISMGIYDEFSSNMLFFSTFRSKQLNIPIEIYNNVSLKSLAINTCYEMKKNIINFKHLERISITTSTYLHRNLLKLENLNCCRIHKYSLEGSSNDLIYVANIVLLYDYDLKEKIREFINKYN